VLPVSGGLFRDLLFADVDGKVSPQAFRATPWLTGRASLLQELDEVEHFLLLV